MKNNMPQMQSAFYSWESMITLIKTSTTTDAYGNVTQNQTPISFIGVIQPDQKSLRVDSSGLRRWSTYMIHVRYEVFNSLDLGDLIQYNGINYKVMLDNDYALNGYIQYNLIEDYQ